METQVSTELNYSKKSFLHPDYKLHRVNPLTGGTSFTITSAGGNETILEIPIKAINSPRSHIYFKIKPNGSGAVGAAKFNWAFLDCLTPFRQVQLYNRANVDCMNLNEVQNYTKIVWKPETKLEEFLDYDYMGDITTYSGSCGRFLCRNNTLKASTDKDITNPYGRRYDNTISSVSYTEPKYTESGTTGANDGGGAVDPTVGQSPELVVSIPLSAFKNTILDTNKDLYFNEIMTLRIVWNSTSKMFFYATSATNPTTGPGNYIQDVAISNFGLYLACDSNPDVINQLQTKIMTEGISMLIPYVHTYKQPTTNAPNYTISQRFNTGHGRRLLKIYHAPFANPETANATYDHNNKGTAKVNRFYTTLNDTRLQEYDFETANRDDYRHLQPKLKGSVIQTSDMFYYNWVWIEDFTGYEDMSTAPDNKENLVTGIDLSKEVKWEFYAQSVNNGAAATYNCYTYAVTQKLLTITSQGMTVA